MKRTLLSIITSIVFIMLTVSPVYASNTKYTLDDLYMTVEVPAGYATLTRDVKKGDKNIEIFEFKSPEAVISMLKKYNAYLNTSPKSGGFSILITMTKNEKPKDFFDLNYLNENELEKLAQKATKNSFNGVKYSGYKLYEHKQAKFIVFDGVLEDEGVTSYINQYYTVYNGQTINITLYSYNKPIVDVAEKAQKEIVDSIEFTTKLKKPFSILSPTGYTNIDRAIIIAVVVVVIGAFYIINNRNKRNVSSK